MKKIALMMALMLAVGLTAVAQEKKADAKPAAAPLPTLDEVLDKYIKAIGGKDAIQKLNSRVAKGNFEMASFGISGPIEMYAKAPNKNAMMIDLGAIGKVESSFDGTKGWSVSPQEGARELTGAELAATKREANFHGELNMKAMFSKMEVKGKEKVGDAEAIVVVATPAEGKPQTMYFDAASGLLLRTDAEVESPQGAMSFQVFTEDYKVIDGVKVPHTIRRVSEAFSMTIKFTEVKHNVEIADSKFGKPAN